MYAIYGMSMGGVLTATLWQNGQLEIEKVIFDGSPLVSVKGIMKRMMLQFYLNITHKSQQRDKKTLGSSRQKVFAHKNISGISYRYLIICQYNYYKLYQRDSELSTKGWM